MGEYGTGRCNLVETPRPTPGGSRIDAGSDEAPSSLLALKAAVIGAVSAAEGPVTVDALCLSLARSGGSRTPVEHAVSELVAEGRLDRHHDWVVRARSDDDPRDLIQS